MDIRNGDARQLPQPALYNEERVEALLVTKEASTAHLVLQLSGLYQELHGKNVEAMATEMRKNGLLQRAISTLQSTADKLQKDPNPRLQTAKIKERIEQAALFLSDIEKARLYALPPAEFVQVIEAALLEKDEKKLRLIANMRRGAGEALLLTQFLQRLGYLFETPKSFHQAAAGLIQWVSPENIDAALLHAFFNKITFDAYEKETCALIDKCTPALLNHAEDPDKRTCLHKVAMRGSVPILGKLLEKGADLTQSDAKEYDALAFALINWHEEAATLLVRHATLPHLDSQASDGNTYLHSACRRGLCSVVRAMCEKGVNPTLYDNKGMAPIHAAIERYREEVALFLVDRLPLSDLDAPLKESGKTALHCAAETGIPSVVKALLKKGVSRTAQTTGGNYPLVFACWKGNTASALHLIDAATDEELQHRDRDGRSALDWALEAEAGQPQIEQKLIERGLKPSSEDALKKKWLAACESQRAVRAQETQTVKSFLINFCYTVLDSMEHVKPAVASKGGYEALGMHYAASSMRRYLQEKGATLPAAEKALVEQALRELEAAEERCYQQEALYSLQSPTGRMVAKQELALQFSNGVKQLLENQDKEVRFVLPGGYHSTKEGGHFVVVEIRVDPVTKKSLELTIINTGAGSQNELLDIDGLKSAELHGRPMYQDIRYVNLQPADLSPEFFMEYIQRSYIDDANSMKPFLECIEKNCLKKGEDGKNNRTVGRAHKVQRKGSCSVKATQSWMHHRLGRIPYFRYKVEMTKYQMEKLQAIGPESLQDATPAELEAMQKAATKVLHKRTEKLEQLLVHENPSPRVLGDLFHRQKEWQPAREQYQEWAKDVVMTKKELPSLLHWMEACVEHKAFADAKRVADRISLLLKDDQGIDEEFLMLQTETLWQLYCQTGDHRDLIQLCESPKVKAAKNPAVLLIHVKMLFKLERYAKAYELCNQILAENPQSLDIMVMKAKVLFNQGPSKIEELLKFCQTLQAGNNAFKRFVDSMEEHIARLVSGEPIKLLP